MIADGLFAVWVETEGLPLCPILCTLGEPAVELVSYLGCARIIQNAALVPCCRNDDTTACSRDTWTEPGELDRPIEVLMRTALALGISWPADLGQLEPEHSVVDP